MRLLEVQFIFSKNFAKFLVWLSEEGYEYSFGEAQRTLEQAKIYLKTGFSKAGEKSLHCQRLAFDLNIFKEGKLLGHNDLIVVGEKWESMHEWNSWGGFFKGFQDDPHFSMGFGKPERNR